MQRLQVRLDRLAGKERRAVAAALDEGHARHHRIARKRVEREGEGPLHQAVDHQAVFVRVDVRGAGVHDGEMQAVRRERPVDQLMRSACVRGAGFALRIGERAHDLSLEPRPLLVGRRDRAGHEAPRVVRERGRPCGSGERIARHGRGERSAAAQEGAASEKSVSCDRLQSFQLLLRSIFWFHGRPP